MDVGALNLNSLISYSRSPQLYTQIREIVEEQPWLLNAVVRTDRGFTTPLISAVRRGDPYLVEYLLLLGANPNFYDARTIGNALDYAVNSRNQPVIDTLLDYNANSLRYSLSGDPMEGVARRRVSDVIRGMEETRPDGPLYRQLLEEYSSVGGLSPEVIRRRLSRTT